MRGARKARWTERTKEGKREKKRTVVIVPQ